MAVSTEHSIQGSQKLRQRLWAMTVVVLFAASGCVGYCVYYDRVVRPRVLSQAGPITLEAMTSDVPTGTILPPAPLPENAAPFYLAALNSYAERRLPYLNNRKLNPTRQEPPITREELRAMVDGSVRRDCDLYAGNTDGARPVFMVYPGGKPWPFEVATDPFADRPYVPVMRALAQSALNEGKEREKLKNWFEAELIYHAVTRMGSHLRQRPGSFMDIQFGLELEQKGLHYLDFMYGMRGLKEKQRRCWRYGDSLARLSREIRRKYAQLGNVEAARLIAVRDKERVWRIVATAALITHRHFHDPGWLEGRSIDLALGSLREDGDPYVRDAAKLLEQIPAKEFANLPPERARMRGEATE